MGEPPWVSVDLLPGQMGRADLDGVLRGTLEATELAPARLVVKVPESSLARIGAARPVIGRITAIGVRIIVDDFWSGGLTLLHLANLPLTFVRIDRSFAAIGRPRTASHA